jgi:hypothetical protein
MWEIPSDQGKCNVMLFVGVKDQILVIVLEFLLKLLERRIH